jgi:hypothetical protein
MTIAITRTDLDRRGLRAAATRAKDAAAARRMLALALVLEEAGTEPRRRERRAWTGRLCAIGFTATTRKACRA